MKLKNILSILSKFLYVRKKRVFGIAVFSTIAFYLCLLIYMEFIVEDMTKINIEQALRLPAEDTYKLKIIQEGDTYGDSDKIKELTSYVKEIKNVYSYGYYYISRDEFSELSHNRPYQNKIKEILKNTDVPYSNKGAEILYIEPTADQICNIQVCEGGNDISKSLGKDILPILVGHSFKEELPIGTILTSEEYKEKYQVVGILKKNSNWLEVGDTSLGYTGTCMNNLDGMLLAPFNKIMMERDFFCFQTHYYFNIKNGDNLKIIEDINKKARELKLNITLSSVREQMDIRVKENPVTIFRLSFLVVGSLLVVALLVSSILGYIIKNKGEYGILFANGLEVKGLVSMTLIENTILIIIPAILSYGYTYYQKSTTSTNEPFSVVYFHALTGKVFWFYLLNVIIIWLLTSFITCSYISKLKTLELIRGLEE